MIRISDEYLESVIYLYPSAEDAEAGTNVGGSGFLVGYKLANVPGKHIVYGVTNAHVVDAGCTTVRANTKAGGVRIDELSDKRWVRHPDGDDVAVCVMSNLEEIRFRTIGQDYFLTREKMAELNIGPGDFVFVAGRFINHEGKQRNLPTARFGNVAQLPWEKVRQSGRQTKTGYFDQESFLVEARSIGGYSGSPVFTTLNPDWNRNLAPGVDLHKGNQWWLLGVDWGHILDWSPVCDGSGRPNHYGQKVQTNTGMMGVVPSWKLAELLEVKELRDHRDAVEELALRKNQPPSELDISPPQQEKA